MEVSLWKYVQFVWDSICFFPDWTNIFHAHVDALEIVVENVLAQPGYGFIDHLVSFTDRKWF